MEKNRVKQIDKWLPEVIAVLVCLLALTMGVVQKEGYHMDELLSFELANAEFNPWIVPTQPQGRLAKFVEREIRGETVGETFKNLTDTVADVLKNKGNSKMLSYQADVYEEPVWIDAKAFQEYITVDGRDAFDYLSVYFNVKDDNHPPVHFMLLHTLSSVFQRCAEPFVGCLTNLAAVTGILILLMRLGRKLAVFAGMEEYARGMGILAALCYGLSTGAMASVLLVRMYALLTFFCVALFAIHMKKWTDKSFAAHNKGLIAVTVLGFLTQYFFLFYCLILAAVTFLSLLVQKRKKEALCYLRSMVTAAVIGLGLFPFAISDVFSSGRGVEALDNLAEGFTGYGARLASFGGILAGRTFGVVMFAALAVVALFVGTVAIVKRVRSKKLGMQEAHSEEAVEQTGSEEIVEQAGGEEAVEQMCRESVEQARTNDKAGLLWCLFLLPAAGYFLLAARMSPYLVDRYIMPLFPFVVLAGVLLLGRLGYGMRRWGKRHCMPLVFSGILVVCQIIGLVQYDGSYMYRGYDVQRQASETYAYLSCICVYEGVGYYENLLEFANYQKTLLVKPEELKDRKDKDSIEELQQVVLLIKEEVDGDSILEQMEMEYGFRVQSELWQGQSVHGDIAYLLEKTNGAG